jgi:hypothetical protein
MNRLLPSLLLSLLLGCGGDALEPPSGVASSSPEDASIETTADAVSPGDDGSQTGAPADDVAVVTEADAAASPEDGTGSSPPDASVDMADADEAPQPNQDVVAEADGLGPGEDVSMVSDAEASWPEGLHGTVPGSALPAPEFVATNHDGSTRGPGDLMGKPTVMWFFPFAGTPG